MSVTESVGNELLISPDKAKEKLRLILYQEIKVRKVTGLKELARDSGVDYSTLSSYMAGEKEPSLSRALSIVSTLGPRAVNMLMGLIDYDAHPSDEEPVADAVARAVEILTPLAERRG